MTSDISYCAIVTTELC